MGKNQVLVARIEHVEREKFIACTFRERFYLPSLIHTNLTLFVAAHPQSYLLAASHMWFAADPDNCKCQSFTDNPEHQVVREEHSDE